MGNVRTKKEVPDGKDIEEIVGRDEGGMAGKRCARILLTYRRSGLNLARADIANETPGNILPDIQQSGSDR